MHRDSECAKETQCSVQKEMGGVFHIHLARHDDTAKLFRKILYWVVKENVPLWKWNSVKGEKADKLALLCFRLSE